MAEDPRPFLHFKTFEKFQLKLEDGTVNPDKHFVVIQDEGIIWIKGKTYTDNNRLKDLDSYYNDWEIKLPDSEEDKVTITLKGKLWEWTEFDEDNNPLKGHWIELKKTIQLLLVTENVAGLMSTFDKKKINRINRTNHTISNPTTTGTERTIKLTAINPNDGTDASTSITIPSATQTNAGLMSSTDKLAIDNLSHESFTHVNDDQAFTSDANDVKLNFTCRTTSMGSEEASSVHAVPIGAASSTRAGVMTANDKREFDRINTANFNVSSVTTTGTIVKVNADKTDITDPGTLVDDSFELPSATSDKAGVMIADDKRQLDIISSANFELTSPTTTDTSVILHTKKTDVNAEDTEIVDAETLENRTIPAATSTKAGVMSADDKTELDRIDTANFTLGEVTPNDDTVTIAASKLNIDTNASVDNTITIPESTVTKAGAMSKTDKIATTNLKTAEDVVTELNAYTRTANTVTTNYKNISAKTSGAIETALTVAFPMASNISAGAMDNTDKIVTNNVETGATDVTEINDFTRTANSVTLNYKDISTKTADATVITKSKEVPMATTELAGMINNVEKKKLDSISFKDYADGLNKEGISSIKFTSGSSDNASILSESSGDSTKLIINIDDNFGSQANDAFQVRGSNGNVAATDNVRFEVAQYVKAMGINNTLERVITISELQDFINKLIVSGKTSIADANTELAKLGTNYSTLLELAKTVKTFLEDTDATNAAINKWQEIESFLSGIKDTDTLQGLLNGITTIINNLDYSNKITENTILSSLSQTDGKISYDTRNLTATKLAGYTKSSTEPTSLGIANTDTLSTAISKLEWQVDKENTRASNAESTLTTNLNSEIAARKAVDGQSGQTYTKNTATNYIKEATSLNDADIKLDAQIKSNADAIGLLNNNNSTTGSVAHSIKTAIEGLDVTDTAVTNQFVTLVSETDGKISVSRARPNAGNISNTAITGSNTQVSLTGTDVQTTIGNIATAIKSEETARVSAISAEATARSNADSTLTTNLNSEIARATAAEKAAKTVVSNKTTGHVTVSTANDATDGHQVVTIAELDIASAATLSSHTGNTSNPHSVTKTQVGLGNVDNTSDANKPVSTAQATAIADAKAAGTTAQSAISTHASKIDNPHSVTKTQVGLGNVTNDSQVKRSEMGTASGVATLDANSKINQNIDASKITSGTISIDRLPKSAIERLTIVADAAARKALKNTDIQNGDTVKETSTGLMYYVKDDTKLDQDAGWEVYTAGSASSVPWSGVTSKPTTISGYGISDAYTKTESDGKYLTSHQSLSNYVTLDTAQTISGVKTFTNKLIVAGDWTNDNGLYLYEDTSTTVYGGYVLYGKSDKLHLGTWNNSTTGVDALEIRRGSADVTFLGKIIKSGGTSSQFLKADGSVDGTAYLSASSYTAADVLAKLKTVDGPGSGLDADLLDGVHKDGFVLSTGFRLSQYNQGYWMKVLTFTIPSGAFSSSISFSLYPSECNRDRFFDLNINIRNNNILFYIFEKSGHATFKCVGDGTTFTVWLQCNKNGWDGYGIIVHKNSYDVNSYDYAIREYQDAEPTGTYSAYSVRSGHSALSDIATRLQTPRTLTVGNTGKSFDGSANVAWSLAEIGALPAAGGTMTGTLNIGKDGYNNIILNPNSGNITAEEFYSTGGGFSLDGYDNNYVLLAGGGVKPLSELGGSGSSIDTTKLFRYFTQNYLDLDAQGDNNYNNGIFEINKDKANYKSSYYIDFGNCLNLNSNAGSALFLFEAFDKDLSNNNRILYRSRWWSNDGNDWTNWKKLALINDPSINSDDYVVLAGGGVKALNELNSNKLIVVSFSNWSVTSGNIWDLLFKDKGYEEGLYVVKFTGTTSTIISDNEGGTVFLIYNDYKYTTNIKIVVMSENSILSINTTNGTMTTNKSLLLAKFKCTLIS